MSNAHSDQARLSEEVRAVFGLSLEELRQDWAQRWGKPPKLRSRDLMARASAYKLQAEERGDLSPSLRRRVMELAKQFSADRNYSPKPGHDLKPGTALIREWQGKRHEVAVTEKGFLYRGEEHRSLSKVAGVITGGKWNGRLFFGLTERSK
jgi:Protein of unknown function (DUF2924)